MLLKPGEAIDCELDLSDAPVHGECVVKLTAVAGDGRRAITLVSLFLPWLDHSCQRALVG